MEEVGMADEYEEALEEVEPIEYGFRSKTTEMAKGKVNIKGERIGKKKRKKEEARMMHPKKKPSVARYIPRPIKVSTRGEELSRSIIGIPVGHDGLKPVQASFRPPVSIFGSGEKKRKVRLFEI
jgi:hypothetical protein